jgi:hypothetical protein
MSALDIITTPRYSLIDVYPNRIKKYRKNVERDFRKKGIRVDNQYDMTRRKLQNMIALEPLPVWEKYENAHVFWDKIVSIETINATETYDVQVAKNHSLLTNGLVTHNSTIKAKLEIIHDILYQHERYIIICSANADLARDKVKDIRDALMDNIELRRVYGPQETREWSMADFVTANDCRVRAFTPKTKVRGFNWRGRRPSKILLDDAEDPEAMLTQLRRDRMSTWFWNDVMKLGNGETNVDVIGTILHPESLLSELLKNPGFRPVKYQAVLSFSDTQESCDLWRQWRDIVVDLSNENRLRDARAFYDTHADVMTEGAEVLWPEHEDYYALMLGRIIEGESSFWQERMNEPLADERYVFDLENASYCRVLPDGILRADGTKIPFVSLTELCAYWDSTPPKKELQGHDYTSCVVGFKDEHGYIYLVDAYLAQEISTDAQIEAIVDLLWRWRVPVMGMEANGYQSLLGKDLREALTRRAMEEGEQWAIDIVPIVNSRNKMMRIRALEPMVANGWLQFGTSLPHEGYRQFAEFIPVDGAGFDDFPDSVEGLVRVLKGLWNRNAY